VVEHKRIAIGVGEDRLFADAGVEGVAEKGDATGFEPGACGVDVRDLQRDRHRVRPELAPEGLVLHDRDRQVAGLELGTGNAAVAVDAGKVEDLAVEGNRVIEDVGRNHHEVDARDEPITGHVFCSFRGLGWFLSAFRLRLVRQRGDPVALRAADKSGVDMFLSHYGA